MGLLIFPDYIINTSNSVSDYCILFPQGLCNKHYTVHFLSRSPTAACSELHRLSRSETHSHVFLLRHLVEAAAEQVVGSAK